MSDRITPHFWFDGNAEEAAEFYTSVFPNSKIRDVRRFGAGAPMPEGTVMLVSFELDGQPFVGLNGGPQYKPSEAVSFAITCDTQEEVDHYWDALTEGGEEGPCGWLKDRFGFAWQVVPEALPRLLGGTDPEASERVMTAMLKMKKIEIDELERAAAAGATA